MKVISSTLTIAIILLAFALVIPQHAATTCAYADTENQETTPTGIKEMSAEEIGQRLSGAIEEVHEGAKPFINTLAKFIIAIAGVMLLGAVFTGARNVGRVLVGLLAVGLGIMLFNNTEIVVGLIEHISGSIKN